ncbi:MAG: hypothetical protein KIT14_16245 [bacterium]|nr:hypothetical protein [bacterium]
MRILPTLVLSLALGTTAHAAALLGSGPMGMVNGTTDSCLVANINPKDLAEVTVSIMKSGSSFPEVSTTCAPLAPNTHCGFQSNAVGGGVRFCTVTVKGSPKAIRGEFCDVTAGRCTSIR